MDYDTNVSQDNVVFYGKEKRIYCFISKKKLELYPKSVFYRRWKESTKQGLTDRIGIDYSDRNFDMIIDYMKGKHLNIDMISNEYLKDLKCDFEHLGVIVPRYLDDRIQKTSWNDGVKGIYNYCTYLMKCNEKTKSNLDSVVTGVTHVTTVVSENQKDIQIIKKENEEVKEMSKDILKYIKDLKEENELLKKTNASIVSEMNSLKNENEEIKEMIEKICVSITSLVDQSRTSATTTVSLVPIGLESSTILKNNEEYILAFKNWLGDKKTWKLLFRASDHNYSKDEFHKYCDDQGETILIIKHIGHNNHINIFGGYTMTSWESQSSLFGSGRPALNDFVYTLSNEHNIPPTQYKTTGEGWGICCYFGFGPVFGSGIDIYIGDECHDTDSSYTKASSFKWVNTPQKNSLFVNTEGPNEGNNFIVDEYEVWGIDQ
ncbi:hypothetical protein WA158_006007 [Blastocystis sp. Blastoise]